MNPTVALRLMCHLSLRSGGYLVAEKGNSKPDFEPADVIHKPGIVVAVA